MANAPTYITTLQGDRFWSFAQHGMIYLCIKESIANLKQSIDSVTIVAIHVSDIKSFS